MYAEVVSKSPASLHTLQPRPTHTNTRTHQAVVDNLSSTHRSLAFGKALSASATLPPRMAGAVLHSGGDVRVPPLSLDKSAFSLAAASQSLQPRSVLGRVSGDIGLPVHTRTPGDLWLWGGAEAQPSGKPPAAVHSTTPGAGAPFGSGASLSASGPAGSGSQQQQQAACASAWAPRLAHETKQLDVLKVAAGPRHFALISHGGELYTWGCGRGGVLGHGCAANAAAPQRVNTLWGKKVQSICCSASTTAAVTVGDELYTWGDGGAGSLGYPAIRQHIPRRVALPTGVAHVSLGPYHAAAVTVDGRLFTWGDGLAGQLGHGGTGNEQAPRWVEALSHGRVLRVACGCWHTAAVVREQRLHSSESDVGHLTLFEPSGGGAAAAGQQQHSATLARTSASASLLAAQAGALYTWGGNLRCAVTTASATAAARGAQTVRAADTHRGCLGHGDLQGRQLPTRCGRARADSWTAAASRHCL